MRRSFFTKKSVTLTVLLGLLVVPLTYLTRAGATGPGHPQYAAVDSLWHTDANGNPDLYQGRATMSGLGSMGSVALDATNHFLYVSDQSSSRITVFKLDNNNHVSSRNAQYVLGQANFGAMTPHGGQNGLTSPYGLCFDSTTMRLFVADQDNNRVLIFETSGGLSNNMNATYVIGQSTPLGTTDAQTRNGLKRPTAVTYDATAKRLFVADSGNSRVLTYDLTGGITNGMNAEHVIGQPDFTTTTPGLGGAARYDAPRGLLYDANHQRLFVADKYNNRVLAYDLSGGITDGMSAVRVLGQSNFVAQTAATTQARMSQPEGMAYDAFNHYLYVADSMNSRVLVFDIGTDITDVLNGMSAIRVIGQPNYTTDVSPVSDRTTLRPTGIVFDSAHDQLFVPSFLDGRIMIFDLGAGPVTNMTATDELGHQQNGQALFTGQSQMNTENMAFSAPLSTMVDKKNHRLYVASTNSYIVVYQLDGNNNLASRQPAYELGMRGSVVATQNKFSAMYGMAYDESRDLLFASDNGNNRVLVFDMSNGLTNSMNATYVIGQPDFTTTTGSPTPDRKNLLSPGSLAFNATTKQLFVADTSHNRVLTFDTTNITNNMDAATVIGQPDFTTNNTTGPTQSLLSSPNSLAIDTARNQLFVGSGTNFKTGIVTYDTTSMTNGMNASNYIGKASFTDTAFGLDGWHVMAGGLVYDQTDQRLFAEDRLGRVLVYNFADGISNNEFPVDLVGQPDYESYSMAARDPNPTDISSPGVQDYYDPTTELLYVSDYYNNRVLMFHFDSSAGANNTSNNTNNNTSSNGGKGAAGATNQTVTRRVARAGGNANVAGNATNDQSVSSKITERSLDDIAGFISGQRVTVNDAKMNDRFTTAATSDKSLTVYGVTIQKINHTDGTIIAIIDATRETVLMQNGQSVSRDIDGDGQLDLSLQIQSVGQDSAEISFKNLTVEPAAVVNAAKESVSTAIQPKRVAGVPWLWILLGGIVAMIILSWFVTNWLHRTHQQNIR